MTRQHPHAATRSPRLTGRPIRAVAALASIALGASVFTAVAGSLNASASSVTVFSDSFSRTAMSSWGSANVGGAWTIRGAAPSKFNVNGTSGTITLLTDGVGANADANAAASLGSDVTATLTTDKVASGRGAYVGLVSRRHTTKELYSASLRLSSTTPTLQIYRRDSHEAQVNLTGTVALTGSTFTAGGLWKVRFSVTGTNPTTLSAKAWKATSAEPSGWAITVKDSTPALQSPGTPGFYSYLSTAAKNAPIIVSVTDFTVSAFTVPMKPQGLTATGANTSARLSWTAASGADGYRVYRDGVFVGSTATSTYTDNGLHNGTSYAYTVSGTNGVGEGVASSPATATPVPPAPTAPTGVTAAAGDGQATVSWPAVSGADSYVVRRDGIQITSTTSTSVTDTGLTDGTMYSYTVLASNASGTSVASAPISVRPVPPIPGTPTGLSASAGDGHVALAWDAVSGATGYDVYVGGHVVASPTDPTFDVVDLMDGVNYSFSVSATNMAGSSAQSAPVTTRPMPPLPTTPSSLQAVAGDARVTLSWDAVSRAADYVVSRDGVEIGTTVATSLTDSTLVNGTTYSYTVTATNAAGSSPASAPVTARPMPPIPTAPSGLAALSGDTRVTLSWTSLAAANSYTVYVDGVAVTTTSAVTYTVTGLTNGVTHVFTVSASNITGTSAQSTSVSARALPPLPATPTAPVAVAGDAVVGLTWSPVTGATGYAVYRNGARVATPTSAAFSDSGLVNGSTYTYTIAATNMAGSSPQSPSATSVPVPAAPSAPTGLTVTGGNAKATLAWTAVAGAIGYTVFRDGAVVGTPSTAAFTDSGLANGTTYFYTVVATNLGGSSSPSAAASATPSGPPPTTGRASADAGSVAVGAASYPVPSGAVFVAPGGSDSNAGTSGAPLATLAKAFTVVPSSGTIVLRAGDYHQSTTLTNAKTVTVQNYPGEAVWVDGSVVVGNFVAEGSHWRADGWTAVLDHSPTYSVGAPDGTTPGWQWIDPNYPMASYPDEVWIDSAQQAQVGTLAEVAAGKFFVDTTNHRLYLGTSPVGHTVRSSDLQVALRVQGANDIVRGIGVRRFATSVPQMGTVIVSGAGSRIENVVIADNATQGMFLGGSHLTVSHVTSTNNGLLGVQSNYSDGLTITGLRSEGNNSQHFNRSPVSGGFKITRSRGVTITDSVLSGNFGNGMWFDESVYNGTVTGNDTNSNIGTGIVVEISDTFVIANNISKENNQAGIRIIDTGHTKIWNNTLVHNNRDLNINEDSRRQSDLSTAGHDPRQTLPDPTMPWLSQYIDIHNNIFDNSTGNALFAVEDYSHTYSAEQLNITTNNNQYSRASSTSPSWLVVWSAGTGNNLNPYVYSSLYAFQNAKGQDLKSVLADNGAAMPTTSPAGLGADVAALIGQPTGDKHMGAY